LPLRFRRLAAALLGLALVLHLGGCGHTRYPAPVREVGKTPRVAAKPAPPGHYRVEAGDTLCKIAFEHGLDVESLAEWNGLSDPNQIQAGALLRLTPPRPQGATKPLSAPPRGMPRALPGQPTQPGSALPLQDGPPDGWAWPVRGELLASYGNGLSKGIDIAGVRGQQVRAAAAGRVAYVGSGLRGYGKLIIIRHGKTLLSAYAHNARILVHEGQEVAKGQVIAEMGDTDTDRVKLHFEIREYGKPVDPLNYLPLVQSPG
jgi:lipoprotein NlpD